MNMSTNCIRCGKKNGRDGPDLLCSECRKPPVKVRAWTPRMTKQQEDAVRLFMKRYERFLDAPADEVKARGQLAQEAYLCIMGTMYNLAKHALD
jgi:hypothetical protein